MRGCTRGTKPRAKPSRSTAKPLRTSPGSRIIVFRPIEMPPVDAPASAMQETVTTGLAPAIGMIAPVREKCGVADYTQYLTDELRPLCDLRYVIDPTEFGTAQQPVDLAHIQHQYFLFGGVAPW